MEALTELEKIVHLSVTGQPTTWEKAFDHLGITPKKKITFAALKLRRYYLYLFTYLLTPWSRGLEKLTSSQLVKKFPVCYGIRMLITVFTSARHLFLSWARWIQSMPPTTHFLKIHLKINLPSTPGSCKWSLSFRFPNQNSVYTNPTYVLHAQPIDIICIYQFMSTTNIHLSPILH